MSSPRISSLTQILGFCAVFRGLTINLPLNRFLFFSEIISRTEVERKKMKIRDRDQQSPNYQTVLDPKEGGTDKMVKVNRKPSKYFTTFISDSWTDTQSTVDLECQHTSHDDSHSWRVTAPLEVSISTPVSHPTGRFRSRDVVVGPVDVAPTSYVQRVCDLFLFFPFTPLDPQDKETRGGIVVRV